MRNEGFVLDQVGSGGNENRIGDRIKSRRRGRESVFDPVEYANHVPIAVENTKMLERKLCLGHSSSRQAFLAHGYHDAAIEVAGFDQWGLRIDYDHVVVSQKMGECMQGFLGGTLSDRLR